MLEEVENPVHKYQKDKYQADIYQGICGNTIHISVEKAYLFFMVLYFSQTPFGLVGVLLFKKQTKILEILCVTGFLYTGM